MTGAKPKLRAAACALILGLAASSHAAETSPEDNPDLPAEATPEQSPEQSAEQAEQPPEPPESAGEDGNQDSPEAGPEPPASPDPEQPDGEGRDRPVENAEREGTPATDDPQEPPSAPAPAPESDRPPAPPPPTASEPGGVFEGRAGTFEFVAADQASLQVARRIGREVLEVCDALITPPQERIPRISVKLAPEGRGNLQGESHRLYQDLAGDYGLAVGWTSDLSAALFIQTLVESYLRQISYTLTDRERAERVPSWLIAALSLRVQAAFRPALVEYLRETGREIPMIRLETLLASRPLEDLLPSERIAAFWFLELVEQTFAQERRRRAFFDAIISGGPSLEVLRSQTQDRPGFGNGIEAWWVIGYQDLVHRESGIVLSLARSGKQVHLLNRFELIDRGQPAFLPSTELWEFRDDPVVRRALANRLDQIRALLPRINPVFYNTLRGMGLVMQALLDGDREAYDARSAELVEELEQAALLARDAQILAENPDADLDTASP